MQNTFHFCRVCGHCGTDFGTWHGHMICETFALIQSQIQKLFLEREAQFRSRSVGMSGEGLRPVCYRCCRQTAPTKHTAVCTKLRRPPSLRLQPLVPNKPTELRMPEVVASDPATGKEAGLENFRYWTTFVLLGFRAAGQGMRACRYSEQQRAPGKYLGGLCARRV